MGTTLSGTTVSRGVLLSGAAQRALELDFGAGVLDSRITFSRGSHAMVTDSTGKLTYAPNNLLTNSESFEASAWNKARASITANAAIAPDGTITADKLVEDTTPSNSHIVSQPVTIVPGASYTLSIYLKPDGRGFVRVLVGDTGGNNSVRVTVNLSTGETATGTAGTGWTLTSASATAVGNGWYRVSVSGSNATATTGVAIIYLATSLTVVSYTGDGTSGIYIWGAQLEAVTYQTTPSTYVSTTPKNLLGYTQEFDNAAWTKSNATAYPLDPATATQGPELVTNGDFSGGSTGWTVPAEWSIGSGVATKIAGVASSLAQDMTVSAGKAYLVTFTVTTISGGSFTPRLTGGTTVTGTSRTTAGVYQEILFAVSGNTTIGILGSTSGAGSIDNISVKELSGGLITAPDGSLTADKLVEDTVNSTHRAFQLVALPSTKTAFSVYAKAAERSWLCLVDATISNGFAFFNLADGVLGTIGANATAEITPVGGGWYRCSIVVTLAGGGDSFNIRIATADGTTTYTGDGTSGIYIWGAQLSNSASVDPYVYNPGAAPSATAAYYGPRFDYDPVTLAPKGLLIEEQRTNLLTYSEQFDGPSWTPTNQTITANSTTSPDGTVDADTLNEGTATGVHSIAQTFSSTSGTSYALSVYLKGGDARYAQLFFSVAGHGSTAFANFDLQLGAIGTVGATATASIQPAGNGWYRCTIVSTATATTTSASAQTAIVTSSTSARAENYTGASKFIYAWGIQVEAGSFATSYIPTVASQVTRSVDVALMQGANFSNWYNPIEGTLLVEATTGGDITSSFSTAITDTSATNIIGTDIDSNGAYRLRITAASINQALAQVVSPTVANTTYKLAGAYRINDFAVSANGGVVGTDTSGIVPIGMSYIAIGSGASSGNSNWNGWIRAIRYFNTRLPNQQLRTLTM